VIIGQGVGRPQMPGFAVEHGGPLQQKQIHDLAVWLMSLPAESK
jgi:mono/diheme cytochrome c family protein